MAAPALLIGLGVAALLLASKKKTDAGGDGGGSGSGSGSSGGGGSNVLGDLTKDVGAVTGAATTVAGLVHAFGGTAAGGTAGVGATATASSLVGGGSAGAAAAGGETAADAAALAEYSAAFDAALLFNPFTMMMAIWATAIIAMVIASGFIDRSFTYNMQWRLRFQRPFAKVTANALAVNLLEAIYSNGEVGAAWVFDHTEVDDEDLYYPFQTERVLFKHPRTVLVAPAELAAGPTQTQQRFGVGNSPAERLAAANLVAHYLSCQVAFYTATYAQNFAWRWPRWGNNKGYPTYNVSVAELWSCRTPLGFAPPISLAQFDAKLVAAGIPSAQLVRVEKNARSKALHDVLGLLAGDPGIYVPWDAVDYANDVAATFPMLGELIWAGPAPGNTSDNPRLLISNAWLGTYEGQAPPPAASQSKTIVEPRSAKDGHEYWFTE